MKCRKGGSEVKTDASNDSLSPLPQSRLPAAACRAQWAYERTSTLSLPALWWLVRRDRGHPPLPAADPTRGDRQSLAARHAGGQPAGGGGGPGVQLRDDWPLAAPGRPPRRGAHPGAGARPAPLHPGGRRILVLRPQKDGAGTVCDPPSDGVAAALTAPASAGEAGEWGGRTGRGGGWVAGPACRAALGAPHPPRAGGGVDQ